MQQKSGNVLNNTGAVPSNLFNVLVQVGRCRWILMGRFRWRFWMQVAPGRDHCRQLPALSWADTITWLSWGIGKKMQKIKFWALGKLVLVKRYQANSWLKIDHCHQIPSLASQTKLQKDFRPKYFWVKKVLVGCLTYRQW